MYSFVQYPNSNAVALSTPGLLSNEMQVLIETTSIGFEYCLNRRNILPVID